MLKTIDKTPIKIIIDVFEGDVEVLQVLYPSQSTEKNP